MSIRISDVIIGDNVSVVDVNNDGDISIGFVVSVINKVVVVVASSALESIVVRDVRVIDVVIGIVVD